MTIHYKPPQEKVDEIYGKVGAGAIVEMKVKLIAEDSRGQAALLEPQGPIAEHVRSPVPHVTMSCANDVGAFYSNQLLKAAVGIDDLANQSGEDDGPTVFTPDEPAEIILTGVLGAFTNDGPFDTPGGRGPIPGPGP